MGISLGLVGLGAFGSAFAELFKNHPLVSRIALCDREPERIAEFAKRDTWKDKFNQNDAYASLDEICAADLDALVIITQPWLHAPQCDRAMKSGKHVYSAVPILCVPDGDEILDWCDRLVETCKQTGMHYMLGETTYYRPGAMYCRRRAQEGAFGKFTYAEGEYFHPIDNPACDLRKVLKRRLSSKSGREWLPIIESYRKKGVVTGPMHYPTHSTSGPVCVMNAHALKVCCWGTEPQIEDYYFSNNSYRHSNQTALFQMSNGATVRICEHRECSVDRETFRIYGTKGSYENNTWSTIHGKEDLPIEKQRDALPDEVLDAWKNTIKTSDIYGGHGGSHAYLVHEFVDAIAHDRIPAINIWEAVRYMAMGVTANKSALRDGEILEVADWGDAPQDVSNKIPQPALA